MGNQVQKLGHFGLEGEGLLGHRKWVVSKNEMRR